MVLYDNKGNEYKAIPCKRPKMSDNSRGTTWDSIYKTIDTVKRDFHLDTTWGRYMYFMYNGIWYKVALYEGENAYDTDNFYTQKNLSINPKQVEDDKYNVAFYYTLCAWNRKCFQTEDGDYDIAATWKSMIEDDTNRTFSIALLPDFRDFKSIFLHPTKAQAKIIKNNMVWRKEEIFK